MDAREKLVELLTNAGMGKTEKYFLADELLSHGVTVQEWISVKDRLPDDNGRLQAFLVCRDQRSATNGMVLIETEYFTNKFDGKDNITHWMPLPEPPKEV